MFDLHDISQESFDFIIAKEVTSQALYEREYRHPVWPREQSGVTGAIGYDFGQASKAQVLADWSGKIPDAMVKALVNTCGVTGVAARPLALKLRDVVDIPWDVALDVFSNHDVPRYLAMCRAHLPGFDELSPQCKGAILSIVFNRGPSFDTKGPRYAEMRDIKAAIKADDLARVPGLIRSMKRIWPDDAGLINRREDEAGLFERGLAEHHPDAHAQLAAVAPPQDPELVAHAQQQLRAIGYYQVGAIDGSLTPRGRTEDAILAFRNKNGLPLTPMIDDAFLAALAKAQPPEVGDHRANATVHDLREQGSETIRFTDQVKAWGGRLFGGGVSLGGSGVLALVTEKATQLNSAKEAVGNLGLTTEQVLIIAAIVAAFAVLAATGLLGWYVADRIEAMRLANYRTGKHP
jgi:hypothetical protein